MSRLIVRDRSDKDWQLNPAIFSKIVALWGPFHVDVFATRLSTLLPRFYSWKPEPLAEATDAFLQDWSTLRGYAHPPWCLVQCCLKKVVMEEATLVMVTPLWSTQSWFPTILSLCTDYPRLIPQVPDQILPTANTGIPDPKSPIQLVAWRISGNPSEREEFLQKLKNSCCQHGEVQLTKTMIQPGRSGKISAMREISIPFLHL